MQQPEYIGKSNIVNYRKLPGCQIIQTFIIQDYQKVFTADGNTRKQQIAAHQINTKATTDRLFYVGFFLQPQQVGLQFLSKRNLPVK